MLSRLRHQALVRWSHLVSYHPRWVLAIAVALAAVCVILAVTRLTFHSNRNDLISPELEWNRRFIVWREAFPTGSDLIVVVDTHGPGGEASPEASARAQAFVGQLGPVLDGLESTRRVVWGFDAAEASAKAIRLLPMDEFGVALDALSQVGPILRSPTPASLLAAGASGRGVSGGGGAAVEPEAELTMLRGLLGAFARRMATPADRPVDLAEALAADTGVGGWQYLRTENGRFLLLLVTPREQAGVLDAGRAALGQVRAALGALREQHPGIKAGVTGIEVIESDETEAATRDSAWASALAIVLIAALLITAFHSVRLPMMMVGALAIGVAWSFGFLTLAVGHLQVISVVFTVILLGIGVSFGIHLASRFEMVRHGYPDDSAGLAATFRDTLETIGPGLLTGAVTTAAAFGTTLLTDFTGVAEMGLIAAAGVLLCLLAMVSVFLAMLRLFKGGHGDVVPVAHRRVHLYQPAWSMPFARRPRLTLTLAGLIAAASLGLVTQMRFDYNLMALLPRGVESVQWQQRVVREGDLSIYFGVSIVESLEEARNRAEAMHALETVESVGGIARLFPADRGAKLDAIAAVRQRLAPMLEAAGSGEGSEPGGGGALLERVGVLAGSLSAARLVAPERLRPGLTGAIEAASRFQAAAAELDSQARARRLDALQADYDRLRERVIRQVREALDPTPLGLADLPRELLAPYIGQRDGRTVYALEVYPKLPEGMTDPLRPGFLSRFIGQMRSVDPAVTGVIVQVFESATLIWRSYLLAGGLALVIVAVLVWLDFGSLRDAGLTLVPVALGFAVTFAVLHLIGQKINPANIIVLPLMFGIGVDAGVHMLHRYRQNPTHRPLGLTDGTGKGVALTTLTTMIGFGSLMIASHRGIAGLGLVMALGLGMTLLACVIVMPALLEVLTPGGPGQSAGPGERAGGAEASGSS